MEFVDIYKKTSDLIDKECKKHVAMYQMKITKVNKEYEAAQESYNRHLKACNQTKVKIEELIETKSIYENTLGIFEKEKTSMKIFHTETKKTKIPLIKRSSKETKSIHKVSKKLQRTNKEIEKVNKLMLNNVSRTLYR